jgi:hypothetical protein
VWRFLKKLKPYDLANKENTACMFSHKKENAVKAKWMELGDIM